MNHRDCILESDANQVSFPKEFTIKWMHVPTGLTVCRRGRISPHLVTRMAFEELEEMVDAHEAQDDQREFPG